MTPMIWQILKGSHVRFARDQRSINWRIFSLDVVYSIVKTRFYGVMHVEYTTFIVVRENYEPTDDAKAILRLRCP